MLSGSQGPDTITGGPGNDQIDGGPGTDTALYSGNQSSHTLTLSPTSTTIADRRVDGNGTDTLIEMEFLDFETSSFDLTKFAGSTDLSAQDFESFIELYIAYFNRAPDAIGLNFWATDFANGTTLEEMASLFVDQDETRSLYPAGTTNEAFVEAFYNNVLGRDSDQSGFDFWVGELENGNSTRDAFILNVLGGVPDDSSDRDYLDNKVDIGAYFAVHKGMSDGENAAAVMELYDDAGVHASVAAINGYYSDALDPNNGEFLLQVVGLLDDPFAIA
jgi:hypothetical protein